MKNFSRYYQDELLFLREKGGAFAKAHPEIASKLDIKNGASLDPQTERIIEAVAFMSAKLHQKIDDNAQDIAGCLLSALYPNLINVFPPCSIARFEPDGAVSTSEKVFVPKNTNLFATSRSGVECLFRTVFPTNIYPIFVNGVNLAKASGAKGNVDGWRIEINLSSRGNFMEKLGIDDLLFHINSEVIEDSLLIYASIFSNPSRSVFLKINDKYIKIDDKNFIKCGFDDKDSICPVPKYSTNSFQLFQEMLHFKRKFMFFRILGLDELMASSDVTEIENISILIDVAFLSDRLLQIVKNDSLIINAVPIVNLFPATSDPFRFDGTKTKYLLLADQAKDKSVEIHSILNVHMVNSDTKEDSIVQPYFSLAVDSDTNVLHDVYWLAGKDSAAIRNIEGFDTYISFVDTKMNPHKIYDNVVYAKTLCTNRFETQDIPAFSNLQVESIEISGYTTKLLHKATTPISFAEHTTALWNLISQLSSTHISMTKAGNLLTSIRGLMNIFSSGNQMKADELLDNIKDIQVKDNVRRFGKDAWRGFVRGNEVLVYTKEEEAFFSYFFCDVLNQYLSSSVSINSFVELKLISDASAKTIASWRPTSGKQDLL
ncbi:MAG: type VI secretion system baseplate subunit TssF [Holosporales bacterium]|jgi:type VI secretion system protein ImpG|nr:type VI secretion system baseplate subunit TssF [Holosporales bacterium]